MRSRWRDFKMENHLCGTLMAFTVRTGIDVSASLRLLIGIGKGKADDLAALVDVKCLWHTTARHGFVKRFDAEICDQRVRMPSSAKTSGRCRR